MKKKIAVAVSLLLVVALSIGGTIAWLTDSETVTNTFTIGNVDITLKETDAQGNKVNAQSFKFVPGVTMAKDPTVTVEAGSEACYVFVKVDEVIGNDDNKVVITSAGQNDEKSFSDYFTYAIRVGEWTRGDDIKIPQNVYYREYNATDGADEDTESDAATYYILTAGAPTDATANGDNGVITVKDTVTKEMVDALNKSDYKTPQLTFTAYAIQKEGTGTAAEAWAKLNP